MSKGIKGLLHQALWFAFAMTAVLGSVPFACATSASFLGHDVSQVAAGIIGFYPWHAVGEVGRVLGLAFCVFFGFGLVGAVAARPYRSRLRWLIFPVAPALAYLLCLAGSVLKYPALYDAVLPRLVQLAVFHLAYYVGPLWFYAAAGLLLGVPAATLTLRRSGLSRTLLAHPVVLQSVVLGCLFASYRLHGAVGGGSLAPPSGQIATQPGGHPNILFIGIDSLRTDRLERPEVTPNLRALINDAQTVQCLDHYVGVPRTFPSWVEMLTGEYAAKTGVRHMFPSFGARSHGFAGMGTALAAAGYGTTAVSDFAGDIFPRFDAGFATVAAPKLTLMTIIRQSVDQAFPAFLPFMVSGPLQPFFPALKESPAYADATQLVNVAEAYIASGGSKPWLTTVFFSTAHFPYAAPYPYYRMFAERSYSGSFLFAKNPEVALGNGDAVEAHPEEVAQVRALYDGALRSVDDALGELFAALKASGQWDSTLIVLTADHGEDLYENGNLQGHGEHLRGENVLRVPLLLKLPRALVPKQRRVDFTTRSIDIAPTVLAVAGVAQKIGDGVNLLPWLTETSAAGNVAGMTTAPAPRPVLAAFAETEIWFTRSGQGFFQNKRLDYPGISGLLNFDQGFSGEIVLNPNYERMIVTAKHRTLIDGDWKLIYMPTGTGIEYELYNRRLDPANQHNLAANDPKTFAAMRTHLLAFMAEVEAPSSKIVDGYVVPR